MRRAHTVDACGPRRKNCECTEVEMTFLLGLVLVGSIVILGIVLVSPHRERRRSRDDGGCNSGADGWSPAFASGGDSACGTADSSGGDCGGGDGGGGGD